MLRWLGAFLGALLSGALLAGCDATAVSGPGTSVVAAFYPYAYVAQRVAGARATVVNLTAPGAEPHDLELSPQQVAEIAEADVVVYERGFQPAVDDAVEQNAAGDVVEVSRVVRLDPAAPGHTRDPHIWQDPTKLAAVAQAVAGSLERTDPRHAADYRRNAADLVGDLRTLDRQFRRGLAHCRRHSFVTSHAAFAHLAGRYGLRMVPIAGISPDVEPSPARLARLEQLVEAEHVTTIFTETLSSPAIARTLADEAGVRTAVLDPIEGLPSQSSGEDYFSLMHANLAALRRANGCT
jgi:zinc transport system substrate-binding protein